jgi:RNA-splicing ligase RtcB
MCGMMQPAQHAVKKNLTDTKRAKYDYEAMKAEAASTDPAVRKQAFVEYFERFNEYPSYLFDNERKIDASLYQTMQDLLNDSETTQEMRMGVDALLRRLPS